MDQIIRRRITVKTMPMIILHCEQRKQRALIVELEHIAEFQELLVQLVNGIHLGTGATKQFQYCIVGACKHYFVRQISCWGWC